MATDAKLLDEVLRLSGRDRFELVERLWDSLSDQDVPTSDAERALLDERIADMEKNPGNQSTWEEVKARLAARKK